MAQPDIADRAERLSKKRARTLPFLAIILITQQATFFAAARSPGSESAASVKIAGWLVLSAVLLAALATKGFWFERREVRERIDDELTRSNRYEGMRFGFIAAMLAAILVYLLTLMEPISGREAAHIVLSVGLGAALLRWAFLERRAHRYE
jgi:hypothetical protein